MSSADAIALPRVFDRPLFVTRQLGATGDLAQELEQRIIDELIERLAVIKHSFPRTVLIGPRTAAAAAALAGLAQHGGIEERRPSPTDDLALEEAGYNCIISLMDLHGVNDVPGYLAQVSRALKADGLAILAFFAGGTLAELRESWLLAEQEVTGGASPRVAPMIDLREAGGLLQRAGLALPVADLDRIPMRYGSALKLMQDVKQLGFSNSLAGRNRYVTSRRLLFAAAETYAKNFSDGDGRLPATVEVAWAMAWKPHASQQQPLKPGSAKARLADVLRVKPI